MATIVYYYYGLPLFECEEGSLLDIVIRDIEKDEVRKRTQYLMNLINSSKPIELPKKRESRDILTKVVKR